MRRGKRQDNDSWMRIATIAQDDMRKTAVGRLREVIKGRAWARQLANERDNEPHAVQRGLFAFTVLAFFVLWIAASIRRARSPCGDRTIDHDP
jgi:hypothetical protein